MKSLTIQVDKIKITRHRSMAVMAGFEFYDFCVNNKIKVDEPFNPVTKKYEVFEVTFDSIKKQELFKAEYPFLEPLFD